MQPSQAVLIGRDGWLFLAGGAHAPLSFALGINKPSEEPYFNFHKNLRRRCVDAERTGSSFIHLVIPDKHTVCSNVFPGILLFSLAESYKTILGSSQASKSFLCPADRLAEIWEKAYYKQDTHLTPFSTLVLAESITEHLNTHCPSKHTLPSKSDLMDIHAAIYLADNAWTGDLGSKIDPPVAGPRFSLKFKDSIRVFKNNFSERNNGIVDIYMNMRHRHSPERVLIFGDSFGRDLASLLANSFFQVVFLRTPFYHPDIAAQIRPTIIISEHVERYLSRVRSDDMRPNFLIYPFLKAAAYQPSTDFAKAFSAVLNYGRPPYDSFVSDLEEAIASQWQSKA